MTPAKSSILALLKKFGQLSDLDLYSKLGDYETGGFSCVVVICCLELQNDGYIEPPHNDPHLWQLSNKGLEYVARAGEFMAALRDPDVWKGLGSSFILCCGAPPPAHQCPEVARLVWSIGLILGAALVFFFLGRRRA